MNEMTTRQIPALTFRQPWAELIVSGRKSIEIRTWSDAYRGPVWIHAGLAPPDDKHRFGDLPLGAYVGVAELKLIVPMDSARWEEWRRMHLNDGPYPGRAYGWVFASAVRFPMPIRGRGARRLFYPPEDVQRSLRAAAGIT